MNEQQYQRVISTVKIKSLLTTVVFFDIKKNIKDPVGSL